MIWHIGNTTVRTPYRLSAALRLLQGSSLDGNIGSGEQEYSFAKLLHDGGVLYSQLIADGIDNANSRSLGRKWRAAMSQLGFITPKVKADILNEATTNTGLPDKVYKVTPNGARLGNADVLAAQQECFLRSLLAYRIPSTIESGYKCSPFSPLRFTLEILSLLGAAAEEEGYLTFHEYALFVQTSCPDDGVEAVVKLISDYRSKRKHAKGQVRAYDKELYLQRISQLFGDELSLKKVNTKKQTLRDYADLSFRYLKATGLVKAKGRGISITRSRLTFVQLLIATPEQEPTSAEYLTTLWNGASLPTDDKASAYAVLSDLKEYLVSKGKAVDLTVSLASDEADIQMARHELEERVRRVDEEEYYRNQANQTEEIAGWLKALKTRRSVTVNGETLTVPKGEAPAYFEWAIWRAFLAINSLTNKPWEARRFQIDQDFLPVHTAPGNGPDIIFEFDNKVLVTEVTLTASSRQEAAEGEPVRRHVAQLVEQYQGTGKDVYGLFLAVNIDTNTAHTFLSGDWYLPDDSKINVQIVPMALDDFISLFEAGQSSLDRMPSVLEALLLRCRALANQDAPVWKQSIAENIHRTVADLTR